MLIEKAFAKCFGSYISLEKGSSRSALIDLTKCPVFTFDFHSKKTLELIYGDEFEKQIELLGLDEEKVSLDPSLGRNSKNSRNSRQANNNDEGSNKFENSFGWIN
jgi:hypothetical protein